MTSEPDGPSARCFDDLILGPAVPQGWGEWKEPECEVWVGALNYADLDALRRRFFETPWCEPNAAQLFVMDQEEGFFRLWMICGGELRQFAPRVPDEEDEGFYHGATS